jgi:hypothetical protein
MDKVPTTTSTTLINISEIPCCPISHEMLQDPIILDCVCHGTVSRSSFMKWHLHQDASIFIHGGRPLCPICGSGLRSVHFVPNVPLREMLEAIHSHGAAEVPRRSIVTTVSARTRRQVGSDIVGQVDSIALSSDGNRVAVGTRLTPNTGCGRVHIYDVSAGGQWTQMGSALVGSAGESYFGQSIALSSNGNRIVVGSPSPGGRSFFGPGRIRVYDWVSSQWTQVGRYWNGNENPHIGYMAVIISSNDTRVAFRSNESCLRILDWTGSQWTQLGSDLVTKGGGIALSSDGTRVAFRTASHSVRILGWTGNHWIQLGSDLVGEVDRYGHSLSLSSDGNRVAIGASKSYCDVGHVRVYEWAGDQWVPIGPDLVGIGTRKCFGYSVALSSDGNRVVVGSPEPGVFNEAGHVEIYDWTGSRWKKVGSDLVGRAFRDRFGARVALSSDGNRVAVLGSGSLPNAGLACLYDL